MLRAAVFLCVFFLASHAKACWLGKGQFSIDGESYNLHQKFETGKDYVVPAGAFILHLRLLDKNKKLSLTYLIQERRGNTLASISRGEEDDIEERKPREIFAKGLSGKPNSIISLTFENI